MRSLTRSQTIDTHTYRSGSVWDMTFSRDPQQTYIYAANGVDQKISSCAGGAEKGGTLGVVWPFLSGRDRRHGRCECQRVPWLETRGVTVIDCRDAHLVQRIS